MKFRAINSPSKRWKFEEGEEGKEKMLGVEKTCYHHIM